MIFLFFPSVILAKPLELSVNAEEAIVMNAKTGKVLFEKNAHVSAYPASTTKIATALLALNKCRHNLNVVFVAERESIASITPQAKRQSNYRSPPYWLETDGTHAGIKKGEELKLHELLHLMMISSANDASNVIAQGIGGSIPKFMDELNAYLQELGCKNTRYNNPHGLHHPEHVTTAYDLALMAKEGLKDPIFRQIVGTARYSSPSTNLEPERHLVQTNQLLKKGPFFYPKAIGVKTGFTQTAGKNLVAAAQDKDRSLIVVALGYKGLRSELYQDVITMFESAFNEVKLRRTLLVKGEQKLSAKVVGAKKALRTALADDFAYEYYPSEEEPVKVTVTWAIPPLPIAKGACVGTIRLIDSASNVLGESPLLAYVEVKATIWHKIRTFFSEKNNKGRKILFVATAFVCLIGIGKFLKRRRAFR